MELTVLTKAGKYDDGPDELAKRRLTQLKKLGLVPQDCEVSPSVGHIGKEWSDMSAQDQAASAKKMQAFAAMVDIVDENIGRVLDYLESTGELDNTFVLFMSDNGAEGAALEALPMMGRPVTMAQVIEKHYNNSFENIGKFNSFTWYGMYRPPNTFQVMTGGTHYSHRTTMGLCC